MTLTQSSDTVIKRKYYVGLQIDGSTPEIALREELDKNNSLSRLFARVIAFERDGQIYSTGFHNPRSLFRAERVANFFLKTFGCKTIEQRPATIEQACQHVERLGVKQFVTWTPQNPTQILPFSLSTEISTDPTDLEFLR